MKQVIHESAEDYLERILILTEKNGNVRSIDIANDMKFSKPSISVAMKKLRENGYIDMDEGGFITLRPAGREIAERIYARHKLFTKMLIGVGVDPVTAADEACRIEHDMSEDTFEKLKSYYETHFEK